MQCTVCAGCVDQEVQGFSMQAADLRAGKKQPCHHAGEITCGYADGVLTREETIAVAFHRRRGTFVGPVLCRHQCLHHGV